MSGKVQPEESPPSFKKPIKCKTDLTAWDAGYLKRKAEVGEKLFTCKSGRQFCYFTDGAADPSEEGVAVVLCLHGANQNKSAWLLPEPLANILLIVPDRFGSVGGSSSTPVEGYSYEDGCKEFLELVDGVYADRSIPPQKKFFVAGHSMGGTWTIEMAACPEVCDKIEAIAPISSVCDVHHPKMTKQELKRFENFPGFMRGLKKKGCCGAFDRCIFSQLWARVDGSHNKGRTGDYGMAGTYQMLKHNTGGDARGRDAMDADPFFVNASLDSYRGCPGWRDSFNEWSRLYGEEWSYDPADVKVPCFIYHGEAEVADLGMAEFNHKLIKGSELTVWPGHGHLSICMEFQRILEALVRKQKVEGGPFFST